MNVLSEWLSSNGLMPNGFCYQWKPTLIWLSAISDTMIALAYFSIPAALVYLVRRRRDVPFSWMFVCSSVFIAACGATHLLEVWTLWVPSYWFLGGVKVLTALASVPTAIFLVRLLPTALKLPRPEELRAANELLKCQAASLKESEERFRQMAENIQEIFWMMDPETKEATYASPAFEQICELPLNSLYSNPTSYRELIHPDDLHRVLEGLEKLENTNHFDEEFRIVCPSGTVKWLRAIGFIVLDAVGKVSTFVGTAQEITARKKMEAVLRESEDRYRDLVEHSTDLICTYNLQGRLLTVNELPAELLGYSREELLNKPMRDFLLPEARAKFDESLVTIKRDGFVKGLMVVLTKSGERRIWEYHNTLRTEGVPVPIVRGIAHDITDQKHTERALRLSEEKFAKVFRLSPVEILLTTYQEDLFLDVNQAFEYNSGFTRAEVIGHTSVELGLWDDPAERAAVIEHIEKHGRLQNREIRVRTKLGSIRVKLYSAEQIEISGKRCLLATCEDITSRKQVEEALRISQEIFSKAFRSSPSLISIVTLQEGLFLEVNESFEKQTGYSRNELLGKTALDVGLWIDPGERETLAKNVEELGYAKDQEVHFRAKSGHLVVLQVSVELIELRGEKCLLTVGHDITARKRAEKELLATKVRMESVLDSVTDIHILFDRNWHYLYVNQAGVCALDRPLDEVLGRTLWDVYPDIVGTELDRQYHRAMDERFPCTFDFYYPATNTWWENRFYPAHEGLAVFATDITKRKQAEEALHKTEELFGEMMNHNPNLVFLKDVEGRYQFINKEYRKTFHFRREEIYGKKDIDIFPPDQAAVFRGSDLQVLRTRAPMEFEEVALHDDGPHASIVQKFPLFDVHGEIYAICGVVTDITERKRTEERLREYERAVEGVEEMIAVIDRNYQYLLANRTFLDFRSLNRDQVVGHSVPEVLDMDVFEQIVKPRLDESFEGKIVKYELSYTYPKIGQRDLLVSYFPIESTQGFDRVVCVLQDITERKRSEAELRHLSGRLLKLQDEERRRISRDLHDSTGQDLVALATTLSQLHSLIPSSNKKTRKLASHCEALANQCLYDVRTLSYLLHPALLDENGLEDAIRHFADGFAERTGIEVELDISPQSGRMAPDVELALFRVLQESLTNIQRHSASLNAKVRLNRQAGTVSLEVSDKGRGTSGKTLKRNEGIPFEVGVGIPSMQERVRLIGGQFEIESSHSGTTVRVAVPLDS
jgi:PAS domain S-box-containing protein